MDFESYALDSLFKYNDEKKLVLPDFQRDLEWSLEKQKSLLASFLLDLPIGSFLLLEGNKNDFASRKIGIKNKKVTPKEECLYLLDGQQRFTTLKVIFSDFFAGNSDWKEIWDNLYSDLRTRWFLRLKPGESNEDIWGYNNLKFSGVSDREPNDLLDFLIFKKVYKTKNEWHSPRFCNNEQNKKSLNALNLALKSAEEDLVPLYALSNQNNNNSLIDYEFLLDKCIEKIAQNRFDKIMAEINDEKDENNRKKKIIEYFEHVEPTIADLLEQNMVDINKIGMNLSNNWKYKILNFLKDLKRQTIPIIKLPRDEINRAIAVFTCINEGGQKLSTFDLIVAKAAKEGDRESLSSRIGKQISEKYTIPKNFNSIVPENWSANFLKIYIDHTLNQAFKDIYLNLLSIFSHTDYGKICNDNDNEIIKADLIKSKKQLSLNPPQINENTPITVESLIRAFCFLQIRCGIVHISDISYKLMVLPIAYALRDDNIWNDPKLVNKMEYWYWSSLFSGRYREGQNERSIKDLSLLYNWIHGKIENPFTDREKEVFKEGRYSDFETLSLQNEDLQKAVFNALFQYILSQQPKDLLPSNVDELTLTAWDVAQEKTVTLNKKDGSTNEKLEFQIKLHDHHIFPLSTASNLSDSSSKLRNDKSNKLNSPLNRTYITATANNLISNKSPNDYLNELSKITTINHFIPSEEHYKNNIVNKEEYYLNLLKKRFEKIQEKLIDELDKLKK